MRTLGRLMIGLILLGLVAGWILRPRLPRRRLPAVIALAFLPAAVHAVATSWWAIGVGITAAWVAGYVVACLGLVALAWWFLRGRASERPFTAPLAVPVQAFVQVALTSALGRAPGAEGAVVDVLSGVVLVGAGVTVAAALVVLLPTRDHFPRFGIPTPRWMRALGRTMRGRR